MSSLQSMPDRHDRHRRQSNIEKDQRMRKLSHVPLWRKRQKEWRNILRSAVQTRNNRILHNKRREFALSRTSWAMSLASTEVRQLTDWIFCTIVHLLRPVLPSSKFSASKFSGFSDESVVGSHSYPRCVTIHLHPFSLSQRTDEESSSQITHMSLWTGNLCLSLFFSSDIDTGFYSRHEWGCKGPYGLNAPELMIGILYLWGRIFSFMSLASQINVGQKHSVDAHFHFPY